ncbi:uncharacterized [Tachysurus ichikawai]
MTDEGRISFWKSDVNILGDEGYQMSGSGHTSRGRGASARLEPLARLGLAMGKSADSITALARTKPNPASTKAHGKGSYLTKQYANRQSTSRVLTHLIVSQIDGGSRGQRARDKLETKLFLPGKTLQHAERQKITSKHMEIPQIGK